MVNARPMDKEDECLLTCEYCFKVYKLLLRYKRHYCILCKLTNDFNN